MTVSYAPFESKSGFISNNFSVDSSGNLTATVVNAATIILNGTVLAGSGQGAEQTLFDLNSDFRISEGSTPYISVINGQVQITNRFDSVGSIDNVDIGVTSPAIGIFTDLSSDGDINLSPIATKDFIINPADTGTIDNINIGVTTEGTGRFSSIVITTEATLDNEVPSKSYVDNKINILSTALSIALGA